MPIHEYRCPCCQEVTERITFGHTEDKLPPLCHICGIETEEVEFSLVARRNPEKGIQT